MRRSLRSAFLHDATERVVPDLTTDVWLTCSHNHWASTDTLRQLFSKMEALVNAHTLGQDFAVLMDMAPVHISAEIKQMLQEELGHIRIIMIPPQTTNFLQPCDVVFMRPFQSTHRRTASVRTPSTTTPTTSAMSIPRLFLICEPILSDSSRQESTQWSTTIGFEFAWKHLRSYDGVWEQELDEARQLHAAGHLFENVREEEGEVTRYGLS